MRTCFLRFFCRNTGEVRARGGRHPPCPYPPLSEVRRRFESEKDYFVDGDKKLQVTISIGGAIITKDDTEMSLFERADKAMYRAKNNGRNQVVMAL